MYADPSTQLRDAAMNLRSSSVAILTFINRVNTTPVSKRTMVLHGNDASVNYADALDFIADMIDAERKED